MNGCRLKYWGIAAALALIGAGSVAAQPTLTPVQQRAPETTAAIDAAEAPAAYPSFASIPAYPKDVRPLSAWKVSITTLQSQGASLAQRAASEPWTLANTEVWASDERAIATAPPPIDAGQDTAAFLAAMRARATPPPPLRHATAGAASASHP